MADVIRFGKWEGKDLEWDVLKETEYSMLLLCRKYMGRDNFYNTTWEEWSGRKWLNGEFIEKAFTDQDRIRIVNAKIHMDNKSTKDNVFILSDDEVKAYMRAKHFENRGDDRILSRSKDVNDRSYTNFCFNSYGVFLSHNSSRYAKYGYYPALYLKK